MAKRTPEALPKEVREKLDEIEQALVDTFNGGSAAVAAKDIHYAGNAAILAARRARPVGSDQPDDEVLRATLFLGRRVKALRVDADHTQEQLAEAMEMLGFDWTRVTVAEVERGGRRLAIDEMLGLAALFGLPVAEWFRSWPTVKIQFADRTIDAQHAFELLTGSKAEEVGRVDPDARWLAALEAADVSLGDIDWRPVASMRPWRHEI